jgi:hypothetical protein
MKLPTVVDLVEVAAQTKAGLRKPNITEASPRGCFLIPALRKAGSGAGEGSAASGSRFTQRAALVALARSRDRPMGLFSVTCR